MRKVGSLCLAVLLVTGCVSSEKLLEKGRYDEAIQKSAEKLRKNPSDSDELYVLKEAYAQANMFDREQIEFLEKENRRQNYFDIYQLYTRLEDRQDVIRSLPSSIRNQFSLVDYDDEIIKFKEGAAEAYYQQGLTYLERGDRESARMAYEQFMSVKNIYNNYRDVDQLLDEAHFRGTNFVLMRIENSSDKVLPEDFDTELRKIGLGDLNSQWVQYESYADTSLYYDYNVVLNIREIAVSPESIERREFTESKEIQDGMKYVLNEDGNVKKDSLGNDIRVPNMVVVTAEVTESIQRKHVLISGSIDYVNLRTDQLIKTEPVAVEFLFEHYSAEVVGNEEALSDEVYQRVQNRPVPFPSNEAMLMNAAQELKERAKQIIYSNTRLLAG